MLQTDEKLFFSVIITTYNREFLLQRAINSLINQTEKDWEAIIVDDGSEDNTNQKATEICILDKRFTYIYQKNQGTGVARNVGISLASGKFITFLDSDDEYSQEHLANRKMILTENQNIDLLHGGAEIIGDPYVPDINNPQDKIHLSKCVIGGTFFIKSEKIREIAGFPVTRFGDDTMFYQIAVENGWNIEKTAINTYKYYSNREDSLCKKYFETNYNK